MAASLKASNVGLSTVDIARKEAGWNKYDPRWLDTASVSLATLKRFWRGAAISRDAFVTICEAIQVDWHRVADSGTNNLESLIRQGTDAWNMWKHDNSPVAYTLDNTDLRGIDLQGADFSNTSLQGANFSGSNLSGTSLAGADLSKANFYGANLRGANITKAQALGSIFTGATLTGACIEDWNINAATELTNITCDYVYLKAPRRERRPREGTFGPGEFSALFQQAIDTVDLIFKDGIDWQAFFQSLQDLRSNYANHPPSIQSLEKKGSGAFVVRLEVPPGADKAAIEKRAQELYKSQQLLLEQRYRAELQAKDSELTAYKEQTTTLMEVVKTMSNKSPIYDFSNAKFAGGFNEVITENKAHTSPEIRVTDIEYQINVLKEHIPSLPDQQRYETILALDALRSDLQELEPDQKRIGRRLKKLFSAGMAAAAVAAGLGKSDDAEDFANNVIELATKLNIPIEQIPPKQISPADTSDS